MLDKHVLVIMGEIPAKGLLVRLLLSWIYAVYFFVAAAALTPVAFILWLLSPIFDPNRRHLNRVCDAYMYRVLTLSPGWTFRFEGLANLDSGAPFVIVANHQSLADIVVLSGIRHDSRWVSKQSIFFVPFLGWIMSLKGDVGVRRGGISSARHMFDACSELLAKGTSVVMFPEGTRSIDGKVHEFKEGPFRLAQKNGVPIVPIAIYGTRDILPKGSPSMNFHAVVTIRVLPPMMVADFGGDSAAARDTIRALIEKNVEEMRTQTVTIASAAVAGSR